MLRLEGDSDHVDLGPLRLGQSERLSFSVDYRKADAGDGGMRLVWNDGKVGLSVEEDGLKVHVAQSDGSFRQGIRIDDLGLDDTDPHRVHVMVDARADRLQVALDGEVVLDRSQAGDIDLGGPDGTVRSWTLGSAGRHDFTGEISDFRADDSADFIEDAHHAPDDMALMA